MTLKEKFEQSDILISRQKRVLSQEKIAEEFAIGFSEWRNSLYVATDYKNLNVKELLEIYKKEQKL